MDNLSEKHYEELNRIVNDFLHNQSNDFYINNLEAILKSIYDIIDEDYLPTEDSHYSINYSTNEYLDMISKFLKSLDPTLESQFLNIISQVDENGTPFVHFINADENYYKLHPEELSDSLKKELDNDNRATKDGIYIHLENNLNDIFTIIHELFHHMNSVKIVILPYQEVTATTFTHGFYTEAVSVIAEKFLGNYLLQNGLIKKNDYNIRMNLRLNWAKLHSTWALLEIIFIKMKQEDIKINISNFLDYSLHNMNLEYLYKIIAMINSMSNQFILQILNVGELELPEHQKYIAAQSISNKMNYDKDGISKFLKLNKDVGDVNSTLITKDTRLL